MGTVTKKELIERVASKTNMTRSDVRRAAQGMLDEIIAVLGEGDRIELRDFGVFETRTRKARIAQNPKTLERVPVPAKNAAKFKAGRLMQQAVDAAPVVADGGNQASSSSSVSASSQADSQGSRQAKTPTKAQAEVKKSAGGSRAVEQGSPRNDAAEKDDTDARLVAARG